MEKEKVIAWLDRKIEADKIMREDEGKLRMCGHNIDLVVKEGTFPSLQVYRCVDELAEAVGIDVSVEKRDWKEYPYIRYFIYKGYIVNDVTETEDGK